MGECDLTCIPTGPLCCCAENSWEGRQASGETEEGVQAAVHVRGAGGRPTGAVKWPNSPYTLTGLDGKTGEHCLFFRRNTVFFFLEENISKAILLTANANLNVNHASFS